MEKRALNYYTNAADGLGEFDKLFAANATDTLSYLTWLSQMPDGTAFTDPTQYAAAMSAWQAAKPTLTTEAGKALEDAVGKWQAAKPQQSDFESTEQYVAALTKWAAASPATAENGVTIAYAQAASDLQEYVYAKALAIDPAYTRDSSEAKEMLGSVMYTLNPDGMFNESFYLKYEKQPPEEYDYMAVSGIASCGSDLYVQSLLASIVATNSPDDVRIMIVDTRTAMYKDFDGVPHMLFNNVATDDMQAEAQMKWLVEEMDRRYKMFAEAHCIRIAEYNQFAVEHEMPPMCRIVAVVDDIAEASKEVQKRVMMLSAKARAVGICLVVKADNPDWFRNCSVMLTNLPTRLVVQTANGQHSQRLLGWRGAEKLRNIGDAYYKSMRYSDGIRVQVAVATQKEVQDVCMSAKNQYVYRFLQHS